MSGENINKNYNKTDRKIYNNWEDVKKLIALENELLKRLSILEKKIESLWVLTNSVLKDKQ